jgi:hypothetical protein
MKVKDFIKELQKLDPETEVMGQVDAEGNGYFRAGIDGECFFTEDYGELRVHHDYWKASDCCLDEDEYQKFKKENRCAVVHPK